MAYISFQPKDYFNTLLWTGNSGNQSITGNDFTADLTWSKTRSHAESHVLMDTVRDAGTTLNQSISSNTSNAEGTLNNSSTLTVNSTGFDLAGTSGGTLNYTGYTYATWLWKAGTTGSGTTTGAGTGKSYTYSVNTTSGFSIVAYTGNGTDGHTIPHHLGAVPKMVIYKRRSGASNWMVYHESIGATKEISLDLTSAASTSTVFNDTAPTSTVNELKNNSNVNANDATFVMYSFAEKKGFSKFGSYTGNGSADGSFIFTGFKPAFVLAKRTNAVESWVIFDNKRDPHNVVGHILHPNNNTVESDQTGGTLYVMDFLSNGFKLKGTDTLVNGSGSTYIYMAFAEHPLVSSNDIPATAR